MSETRVHYAKQFVDDFNVVTLCGRWTSPDSVTVVTLAAIRHYQEVNADNPLASHPSEFVDCKVCVKRGGPNA